MMALSGVADVVHAAIAGNRIVGAVVAIAHRGTTVMLEAFGQADRELARSMTTDSIFLLASATKPIASAAIVALHERNIVDLERPVTDYLPNFHPNFEGRELPITLRQLLTHTSGLSYPFREPPGSPYHLAGVASGLDHPGLTAEEQLRRLASVPLLFAPGTRWNYSLGVDVAALAAASAAQQPFPQLVEDLVTTPLQMADTAFAIRDAERLVTHYGVDKNSAPLRMTDGYEGPSATGTSPARFFPSRLANPASYPSGGGGMAGTATDLLAFIEALRTGRPSILSETSRQLMTANALPPDVPQALEPGWGYGIGTETLIDASIGGGPERPGTFKGSGGYGHRWFVDPKLELSAAILTNSAPEGVRGPFVNVLRDAICKAATV